MHTHYKCTITAIPYRCVLQSRASDIVIVNIQLLKYGHFQGKLTWICVFVCLIKVMRAWFSFGHFTIIKQIRFWLNMSREGKLFGNYQ